MKIAIYSQYRQQDTFECLDKLLLLLLAKKTTPYIEKNFQQLLADSNFPDNKIEKCGTFKTLDKSFDLMITIGGDGTILRAITYVKDLKIPIVGINTGRLGFLATIQIGNLESAVNAILEGKYKISERTLLSVTTEPENESITELNFALNEIAVSRRNTTSMITVDTHLNDEYLTSYWADGLIIATPTGSTGYSLSCGGPVITPDDDSLVLTPIAPHNLNARPLVISSDTEITLRVSGREENYLISLDSRIATLHNSAIVKIKKADFCINMVELLNESFIDTLRKKLLWGEDKRN